tara:strand:- start:160 stop:510 length:351 start_codon:yes stop_codon:yes gene_type:complete
MGQYGSYGLAAETIGLIIQGAGTAAGAGISAAGLITANKQAKKQLKVQERIGRLQLAQAERSGNRDRIVEARSSLLQLQGSPAYQLMADTQRRNAVLLGISVLAILGLTFFVTRKP